MTKLAYTAFSVLLIFLLTGLSIWWSIYKYKDCRRVGHTTTYCVLDMGK